MIVCPKCGREYPEGDLFCDQCGVELVPKEKKKPAPEVKPEKVVLPPAAPREPISKGEPTAEVRPKKKGVPADVPREPVKKEKPTKSKRRFYWRRGYTYTLVVLALVIAGSLVYLFVFSGDAVTDTVGAYLEAIESGNKVEIEKVVDPAQKDAIASQLEEILSQVKKVEFEGLDVDITREANDTATAVISGNMVLTYADGSSVVRSLGPASEEPISEIRLALIDGKWRVII